MAGRNFSVVQYFDTRCKQIEPLCAFRAADEKEARGWRMRAGAKIRDLLGEMPQPVDLAAETLERADMGSYVREKFVFDADELSSVPGYILIPKDLTGPAPAILCLHGHGPGKDPIAGVTTADQLFTEEQKTDVIHKLNYDYARQFAERGYVTITFDYRCFGERADPDISFWGHDRCDANFNRGSLLGISLLALDIHDTFRAIDYLEQREEVDPTRIGCVGLSFGGTMSLWTAALEKRVKVAVISGYLGEFESFAINLRHICGSQFVPALRRYFEICDIAALIAPKPLLIESGANDTVFPIDAAKRAFCRLRKAYQAWGKPERLAHDIFEGGHEFHGTVAYEWFDRWLTGDEL